MDKAIFLDRDGVINYDYGFVYKWSEFEFIDGAIKALQILSKSGFRLFIITNQSGIARGFYSKEDLEILHIEMLNYLSKRSININEVFYCPHFANGRSNEYSIKCSCRKPQPGMIFQAKEKYNINMNTSYLVGDKISDLQAGWNAGIKFCYLVKKNGKDNYPKLENFSYYANDLYEFAKIVTS